MLNLFGKFRRIVVMKKTKFVLLQYMITAAVLQFAKKH